MHITVREISEMLLNVRQFLTYPMTLIVLCPRIGRDAWTHVPCLSIPWDNFGLYVHVCVLSPSSPTYSFIFRLAYMCPKSKLHVWFYFPSVEIPASLNIFFSMPLSIL